jgi:glycyl-tRNA synthetase alpha subunit
MTSTITKTDIETQNTNDETQKLNELYSEPENDSELEEITETDKEKSDTEKEEITETDKNIEKLFEKAKSQLTIDSDNESIVIDEPMPKIKKEKKKRDPTLYVVNPLTKKQIKIDGPKYKELVALGHTFELSDNYEIISEKIKKNTITKNHDLTKEVFNVITKRYCKIGSPSYKKMIELQKNPEKIVERKMMKGPSGRNIIIGGKTYMNLVKKGEIII